MVFNPYHDVYNPELLLEYNGITAAWSQAETELQNLGAPASYFLEMYWDGSKIKRIFDDTQVSTLPLKDQLHLYPQLNGLYALAVRNYYFP